jgi:hypothetical protein
LVSLWPEFARIQIFRQITIHDLAVEQKQIENILVKANAEKRSLLVISWYWFSKLNHCYAFFLFMAFPKSFSRHSQSSTKQTDAEINRQEADIQVPDWIAQTTEEPAQEAARMSRCESFLCEE